MRGVQTLSRPRPVICGVRPHNENRFRIQKRHERVDSIDIDNLTLTHLQVEEVLDQVAEDNSPVSFNSSQLVLLPETLAAPGICSALGRRVPEPHARAAFSNIRCSCLPAEFGPMFETSGPRSFRTDALVREVGREGRANSC
jgi:hypothetical protein